MLNFFEENRRGKVKFLTNALMMVSTIGLGSALHALSTAETREVADEAYGLVQLFIPTLLGALLVNQTIDCIEDMIQERHPHLQ